MVYDKVSLRIGDKVLEKIIESYTRESGVRELDRQLAAIMRNQARDFATTGKVKSPLTVSVQDVEDILGTQRYSNEIYKTANMPALQLALHGRMLAVIFYLLKPF